MRFRKTDSVLCVELGEPFFDFICTVTELYLEEYIETVLALRERLCSGEAPLMLGLLGSPRSVEFDPLLNAESASRGPLMDLGFMLDTSTLDPELFERDHSVLEFTSAGRRELVDVLSGCSHPLIATVGFHDSGAVAAESLTGNWIEDLISLIGYDPVGWVQLARSEEWSIEYKQGLASLLGLSALPKPPRLQSGFHPTPVGRAILLGGLTGGVSPYEMPPA